MELLLRLYEGNKIKSETSIYQLEYTDEIRNQNSKGILVYKGLELNVLERNVNLNKKQVPFTSKEFEILFFLASYPGQVFTHRQIYEAVWGKEYFRDEGNVTAHIGRIRKKIEPDPRNPIFIQTVRGIGYKFVEIGQVLLHLEHLSYSRILAVLLCMEPQEQ